jgi:glycine/D-amino acid oxidase-like deaminating enzyme
MAGKIYPPERGSSGVWHTDVLVIGGGATGMGIARDLALRGVSCIVVDWRDSAAGASGGNHGLLHSGARYVKSDREAAAECREEGDILKCGYCLSSVNVRSLRNSSRLRNIHDQ